MSAQEFYTNILMGVAGNTAYDGLKSYLQQWQNIVLPKAQTEDEVLQNLEMLLKAAIQNIETQNLMVQQLTDIAQAVQQKAQSFSGNNMINNFGTVEKQVNNPTVQGDFNM